MENHLPHTHTHTHTAINFERNIFWGSNALLVSQHNTNHTCKQWHLFINYIRYFMEDSRRHFFRTFFLHFTTITIVGQVTRKNIVRLYLLCYVVAFLLCFEFGAFFIFTRTEHVIILLKLSFHSCFTIFFTIHEERERKKNLWCWKHSYRGYKAKTENWKNFKFFFSFFFFVCTAYGRQVVESVGKPGWHGRRIIWKLFSETPSAFVIHVFQLIKTEAIFFYFFLYFHFHFNGRFFSVNLIFVHAPQNHKKWNPATKKMKEYYLYGTTHTHTNKISGISTTPGDLYHLDFYRVFK